MGTAQPLALRVMIIVLERQISMRGARPLAFFWTATTCCWHAGSGKVSGRPAEAFDLVIVSCFACLLQDLPRSSASNRTHVSVSAFMQYIKQYSMC